jgi:dynein light chain Tctex-type 1
MADPTNEEPTFSSIKQVVEDKIDAFVNKKFRELNYDARQAQPWANNASEEIIKIVQADVSQDFKFMCTLIVLQKGDTGFHMSASCFWESKSDGNFNKKYEFEHYYVIVNFFGIARN